MIKLLFGDCIKRMNRLAEKEIKLASNGILAKTQPLKICELISIFYKHIYNPIMTKGKLRKKLTSNLKISEINGGDGIKKCKETCNDLYYPKNLIEFSSAGMRRNRIPPTQKPIALLEYLIKTYTNPGDTVLDFTMGSGTAGVACKKLNRSFIGIENNEKYYDIAEKRIENTIKENN